MGDVRTRVEEVIFAYRGMKTQVIFVRTRMTDWGQPWVTREGMPSFHTYELSWSSRQRLMPILMKAIHQGIVPWFRVERFDSGLTHWRFDVRNLVDGKGWAT